MLVLTRKSGETLIVDQSVRITLLSIRGGRVRLGIEAPAEVQITRCEREWLRFSDSDQRPVNRTAKIVV